MSTRLSMANDTLTRHKITEISEHVIVSACGTGYNVKLFVLCGPAVTGLI